MELSDTPLDTPEESPVDHDTALLNIVEDTISDLSSDPVDEPTASPAASSTSAEPTVTDTLPTPAAPVAAQFPTTDSDDAFAAKYGITIPKPGENNRMPYDRHRKILIKNMRDVVSKVEGEFKPKLEQFTEYASKVQDYETRLDGVAQFEHVMLNDPAQFFQLLSSQIPAYREFFTYVNQLAEYAQGQQPEAVDPDPRPTPKSQPDGSIGYDEAGLEELLAWNNRQALNTARQEMQPLMQAEAQRQQYAAEQHVWNQNATAVKSILTEARTKWEDFVSLEKPIEDLLAQNQSMTLREAYLQARQDMIVPRMSANRDKMRQDILAEINRRGVAGSTAAPVRQSRTTPTGPDYSGMSQDERLLAIVAESVANLQR